MIDLERNDWNTTLRRAKVDYKKGLLLMKKAVQITALCELELEKLPIPEEPIEPEI